MAEGETLVKARTTYHFLNELQSDGSAEPYSFVNKHGETVDYQIVKDDEKLDDPGAPVTGLEKNFLGWFIVNKNGETYTMTDEKMDFDQEHPNKADVTTGDLDIYLAPRYGKAFIVTYWDNAKGSPESEMHIVAKRVVYLDEGKEYASVRVDNVTVPTAATHVLNGWTSDDYKEGKQTTYTLNEKPVWDEITRSFNLYPTFSDGHWLRFSGGPTGSGAGYRSAIFVTSNTQASELASLGTVAREGYTFAGWYYDGFEGTEAATDASGNAKNASDLLARVQAADGDTVLYGHWTGKQVQYRVATWFENADDDGEAFGSVTSYTGNAGATTTVRASAVNGFTAQTIEQQTIKGDGTTVVNVHYKRNEYSIRFYNRYGEITSLRITAKYGADIHQLWPGVREGTTSYSALWLVRNGNKYVSGASTMPLNGASYTQLSEGYYYFNTILMVQNVDGSSNFSEYVERPFSYNDDLTFTEEDFTAIDGFRVNAYSASDAKSIRNKADTAGSDPNATYDSRFSRSPELGTYASDGTRIYKNGHYYYTSYFYYLRNQYSVSFDLQKSGVDENGSAMQTPAALSNIYYEANIATTKAADITALNKKFEVGKTKIEVTGEGTYVFQGWYDNAAGMGEPFNFDQEMPAGNITLYAKWERVWYLIKVDPRGGEILPDVNEVTYTWLQYGDKVNQYNIRRDYVEAADDYVSTKYYYVSLLADQDPNIDNTSGYYDSHYRKGFYIPTTDVNNAEYSWWEDKGFIDTTTEYMPSTTNDNYAFVGWYNAADDKVYDFNSIVTGETSIYAKWRRSGLFSIQYHTENGPVSGQISGSLIATDSSYADQATTEIAYKPDKITSTDGKAYVFTGWKLADPHGFDAQDPGSATLIGDLLEQGDEFVVNAENAGSNHVIHLVAMYELAETNPDTIPVTTLTFEPNFPAGATGTSGEAKTVEGIPMNTSIDLSKGSFTITLAGQEDRTETIPVFTADGYRQTGWNTQADGSGENFTMKDVIGVDSLNKDKNGIPNTLYAVWEQTYFYVYHSSDCTVEKISFDQLTDGKFDITSKVKDGYLYGGYYTDYVKKGDYDTAKPAEYTSAVPNSKAYVGGLGYWKKAAAYTAEPGTAMTPVANYTYFLKEVPAGFLACKLYIIYDAHNDNTVVKNYLITDVDDNNYADISLYAKDITTGDRIKLAVSYTLNDTYNNKTEKITAKDTFGMKAGYIAVWNPDLATKDFEFAAAYTTPDGVPVEGAYIRQVTIGDGKYKGNFTAGNDGFATADRDNDRIKNPGQIRVTE